MIVFPRRGNHVEVFLLFGVFFARLFKKYLFLWVKKNKSPVCLTRLNTNAGCFQATSRTKEMSMKKSKLKQGNLLKDPVLNAVNRHWEGLFNASIGECNAFISDNGPTKEAKDEMHNALSLMKEAREAAIKATLTV